MAVEEIEREIQLAAQRLMPITKVFKGKCGF